MILCRLYSQEKCAALLGSLKIEIQDMNLCAVSGGGGDACRGDSGGGLIKKTSNDG